MLFRSEKLRTRNSAQRSPSPISSTELPQMMGVLGVSPTAHLDRLMNPSDPAENHTNIEPAGDPPSSGGVEEDPLLSEVRQWMSEGENDLI